MLLVLSVVLSMTSIYLASSRRPAFALIAAAGAATALLVRLGPLAGGFTALFLFSAAASVLSLVLPPRHARR